VTITFAKYNRSIATEKSRTREGLSAHLELKNLLKVIPTFQLKSVT